MQSILAAAAGPMIFRSGIGSGILMPVREIIVPEPGLIVPEEGILMNSQSLCSRVLSFYTRSNAALGDSVVVDGYRYRVTQVATGGIVQLSRLTHRTYD